MDFLAGFTIFILGLILVINLVPGILIGINSQAIDYDAVAYRTAVILVEDPGAPATWEQKDNDHKYEIKRLGLALSTDSPNILSRYKASKFFNEPDDPPYFAFTVEEYEEKVIFADWPYAPYAYNISLLIDGEGRLPSQGTDVPDTSYGYIRRLVKVKEGSFATINMSHLMTPPLKFAGGSMPAVAGPGNFTKNTSFVVRFDYDELIDLSRSEAHRIDPKNDPVTVTLDQFPESVANVSDVWNITLNNVRFWKGNLEVPMNYSAWENNSFRFYDVKEDSTVVPRTLNETFVVFDTNATDPAYLNTSQLRLEFNPPMRFSESKDVIFDINFNFTYLFQNSTHPNGHRYIEGVFAYDYANATQPALKPGVLEVAIW